MNPAKVDPTRTLSLRNQFVSEMRKRFRKIRGEINHFLVEDDELGLGRDSLAPVVNTRQYAFRTDAEKIRAYQEWLRAQADANVLSIRGTGEAEWSREYIESAYRTGMSRAYTEARKRDLLEDPVFLKGKKAEFLRQSFAHGVAASRVELLSTRVFSELKNITDEMGNKTARILAQGLVDGTAPRDLARQINHEIDTISKRRAYTLARTEIIHAHAEGQLDTFEALDFDEVAVLAEWSTAGDDRVCPECEPLDGQTFTLKEARGMIPRHPNCRCMYVPVPALERKRKP